MRGLWLLAFFVFPAAVACAQSKAEAAEAAYRAGEYDRAKDLWSAMLEDHGGDGRLEYDIGNCEFRLGRYAHALWRYERAQRALGSDDRVRFNRELAERKLGLDGSETSSFFGDLRARIVRLNRGDWFTYGLGFELAGLLVLIVGLRRRARLVIGAGVLLAVAGALGLARAGTLDPDRVLGVIVLEDGAAVRGEPRRELDSLMKLGAGVRAEFVAKSPGWVRVRLRDREGWVTRKSVGLY